jgi:hypothetical protein
MVKFNGEGLYSGVRRKRDPPKILCFFVLLDELDSVSRHSLKGGQLGDDAGRNLRATLISHLDDRADRQLTFELNGSSVFVQVGGFGGHGKRTFLAIFARQSHRCMKGHSTAPAPCDQTAIEGSSCDEVYTVGLPASFRGFQAHVFETLDCVDGVCNVPPVTT